MFRSSLIQRLTNSRGGFRSAFGARVESNADWIRAIWQSYGVVPTDKKIGLAKHPATGSTSKPKKPRTRFLANGQSPIETMTITTPASSAYATASDAPFCHEAVRSDSSRTAGPPTGNLSAVLSARYPIDSVARNEDSRRHPDRQVATEAPR